MNFDANEVMAEHSVLPRAKGLDFSHVKYLDSLSSSHRQAVCRYWEPPLPFRSLAISMDTLLDYAELPGVLLLSSHCDEPHHLLGNSYMTSGGGYFTWYLAEAVGAEGSGMRSRDRRDGLVVTIRTQEKISAETEVLASIQACYSMLKFSTMPLAAWDSLTWGLENKHMMV